MPAVTHTIGNFCCLMARLLDLSQVVLLWKMLLFLPITFGRSEAGRKLGGASARGKSIAHRAHLQSESGKGNASHDWARPAITGRKRRCYAWEKEYKWKTCLLRRCLRKMSRSGNKRPENHKIVRLIWICHDSTWRTLFSCCKSNPLFHLICWKHVFANLLPKAKKLMTMLLDLAMSTSSAVLER